MPKKMLYIENVATANASSFYRAALEAAHICGYEFHLAYNCIDYSESKIINIERELGLSFHQIDFVRNPFHPSNKHAAKQLKTLIENEHFDFIHCNTPIGGVVGRLVAKQCGVTPVIYQAHGFHFYSGSPMINWLLYCPVEKVLAHITDTIITINKEDYVFAQRHLHPRKRNNIYYVPGVGIDLSLFSSPQCNRQIMRESLKLTDNDIAFLVVGRLEKNKNVGTLIEAISKVKDNRVKLILCGDGELHQNLMEMTDKLGVRGQVCFLGNRKDMADIYHAVDGFAMASYREGLSRSLMEAMAAQLPCVVSKIRGNVDLIDDNGGFLCLPTNSDAFAKAIKQLAYDSDIRKKMGLYNSNIIKDFSLDAVTKCLINVYKETN